MKKKTILLSCLAVFLICSIIYSCKKNASDSEVKDLTKTDQNLSENNKKEKLLSSLDTAKLKQESRKSPYRINAVYNCGSSLSGNYYGTGYYSYPANSLDLSSTPQGAKIEISVSSYDVPNRFTVKDGNGNIVASTSWMGYANYSGPWGMSLNTSETETLNFTRGANGSYTLIVETSIQDYSDSWNAAVYCTAPVTANNNHLKFTTISSYEQYANNELDRSILTTLGESTSITTMQELDPNNDNDLYPEFLEQILNQDHIVEIESFLIKVDLENQRVLAINSGVANAYQTLVTNQLTAQGLMNFNDDVSNGIEILTAIKNGTLSTSDYQSAIETSDTTGGLRVRAGSGQRAMSSCRHARRKTDKDEGSYGVVWDTKLGNTNCPDNLLRYNIDNKVVYQKAVIYFSLESKMKSFYGGTVSFPKLRPVEVRVNNKSVC